ncbi:MAG: UDP-galactopyranose mutase [Bacteroides sp.]|nr:UDP-galactopyranose mutase [Bacteroides sp.]
MKRYDYLIVGAGPFGSTFAHLATKAGKRCLVIDKRPHIGGNLYCGKRAGINIHSYGAHIFYTSDRKIWDFVNSLVPFNRFTNCPLAYAPDRKLYHLPFNMNTFHEVWGYPTPDRATEKLKEQQKEARERLKANGIDEPRNLEEHALCLVGKDLYELLVKHYTEKQWGRPCTELPASIMRRLPVRMTFDNNYYDVLYQGIPEGGYNPLIERLLEGSDVRTDTDFRSLRETWREIADRLVFTGALDEFFDYSLGKLEWRSLRFETEILDTPNFQGNAVVNYTDAASPWTRIIEHKHFETFGDRVFDNPQTVISREYPVEFHDGMEPYYPINDPRNEALADAYKKMGRELNDVIFGGRLAEYRYYNMSDVLSSAFRLAETEGLVVYRGL